MSSCLCGSTLFAVPRAFAAFDDAPFGARDAAMGGAFTAVHDEVGAISYNPAALGQAPAVEGAASYINGLDFPAGAIERDISRAAVAVPVRQEIFNGAFGAGVRYDRRTGVAKDRQIGISYGTRGFHETEGGAIDFGVGLKTLRSSLEAGGTSKTKANLDLGALWRYDDKRTFGASLINFGGAKFVGPGSYLDRAPLALKVGAAESVRGSLLSLDGTVREPSSKQGRSVSFAAGFEKWWPTARNGAFAGRSGLSVGNLSRQWTWGAGWKSGGARVDYAMGVPLTGVARFMQALTVSVRFGRSDPEAEYERLLGGEMEERRRLARSLEAAAVRQQALSEEIGRQREEIAALRESLAEKGTSEESARRKLEDSRLKLQELEAKHKRAAEAVERLREEQARNAVKTKAELFREDWAAYERSKMGGAPDSALIERLERLLVEYKDAGVDLGDANQELRRLLQSH